MPNACRPEPAPLPRAFPRWRDLRPASRWVLVGLTLLTSLVCFELMSYLYWRLKRGLPAVRAAAVWNDYYPEWIRSGIDQLQIRQDDNVLDVLLLGGSTLTSHFGDIDERLGQRLAERTARPVRVVNLSGLGRLTRDSWNKYRRLAGRHHFDLVVIYHALNDVSVNCCPTSAFRADYSHVPRLRDVRALEQHSEFDYLAFPFTTRQIATAYLDQLLLSNRPRREWQHFGSELKSPPSFRAHLETILHETSTRGERVVLMTYAAHIPADYTEEAFLARQLDYASHGSPVSTWGLPDPVARALDAHNQVIESLAREHPEHLFVDQHRLMPRGKTWFNDCCHFTPEGCARFTANIVDSLDWEWAMNESANRKPPLP